MTAISQSTPKNVYLFFSSLAGRQQTFVIWPTELKRSKIKRYVEDLLLKNQTSNNISKNIIYFDLSNEKELKSTINSLADQYRKNTTESDLKQSFRNILDEINKDSESEHTIIFMNGFFKENEFINSDYLWLLRSTIQKHKNITYSFWGNEEIYNRFFINQNEGFFLSSNLSDLR